MRPDDELLDMKQAAVALGRTVDWLRRLVHRSRQRLRGYPVKGPTIKFLQSRPYDEIKFRKRWLDEYLDACTQDPESVPLMVARVREDHRPLPDDLMAQSVACGFAAMSRF